MAWVLMLQMIVLKGHHLVEAVSALFLRQLLLAIVTITLTLNRLFYKASGGGDGYLAFCGILFFPWFLFFLFVSVFFFFFCFWFG